MRAQRRSRARVSATRPRLDRRRAQPPPLSQGPPHPHLHPPLCRQVAQADGEVIITNDGATILNKMRVEQPAAKMLVDLAKSQVGGWRGGWVGGRVGGRPVQAARGLTAAASRGACRAAVTLVPLAPACWPPSRTLTRSPHARPSCFQDVVAGDGTTSVTVLCGALLKKSLELLERGAWPCLAGWMHGWLDAWMHGWLGRAARSPD